MAVSVPLIFRAIRFAIDRTIGMQAWGDSLALEDSRGLILYVMVQLLPAATLWAFGGAVVAWPLFRVYARRGWFFHPLTFAALVTVPGTIALLVINRLFFDAGSVVSLLELAGFAAALVAPFPLAFWIALRLRHPHLFKPGSRIETVFR